ncbi:2Fe-2S iron-sulfur cluster-binding protein (plasmid) [Salipiger sp. H15]|uniref:2Fe-2S iron-sulfur cluster-binding protein n=1 Tax=Alloyangia sp. H15 TaxID=3029062 RepID=A0AAU8ASH3_9RHOB
MTTMTTTGTIAVTFLGPDGVAHPLRVRPGGSLMEAARDAGIEGIVAECGGACTCATCHVHVEDAWRELIPAPVGQEIDMLDFTAEPGPGSRLSCQIRLCPELDGLTVRLPVSQY